jgi:FkbM family methyltransferase
MTSGTVEAIREWLARVRAQRDEVRFLRSLAPTTGCKFLLRRGFATVRRGRKEIRISRANTVYAQDLIRNVDYYFEVVEPRREAGLEVVDYSWPRLHTLKEDGIPFWFPELAESMETTRLYLDRADLRPGQTVFDLGAYAGGATYHFSRAVGPGGRVFAFEPDPGSFDCLLRNISLHRLDNVVPSRLGIWSENGRVLFQAEGNMGSAIVEASARSSDTKRWIDVVTLASFSEENGVSRVDFVKLDVEGSEGPILGAAARFIERYRPRIIVEVHFVQGVRSDPDVIRILESHGYDIEVLDQAGLALPLLFARPG